jgi:PhoH-like ATPase
LYNGLKIVTVTDQELADFYDKKLRFDLLVNQYLILQNEKGKILDKYKNDGKEIIKVKYHSFDSQLLGKIKPKNERQSLLCDLLDTKIPLLSISGIAGSGKTFCTTAHALQELQRGNYEKIVIIRNNTSMAGVSELGILPGDAIDKQKESCAYMGDIISDFYFDSLLSKGTIQIAYLGTLRSRSLNNSYILVNEAQNLDVGLVKMIVTRVGENSRLIFDFDLSQIDKKSFEKENGMMCLNESLQGHPLFGAMELDLIERSEVAKLANLIHN